MKHSHNHAHSHSHAVGINQKNKNVFLIGIGLNMAFVLAEVIAGFANKFNGAAHRCRSQFK